MLFLLSISLLFALSPASVDVALRMGWLVDTYPLGIGTTLVMLLGVTALVAINRRRMTFSTVTKRLVATVYATLGVQLLMLIGDWVLGSEPWHTVVRLLLVFSFVTFLFAVQYTLRFLVSAAGFLVCHWIGLAIPDWRLLLIVAGCVILVLDLLWIQRWAVETHGLERDSLLPEGERPA